MPARHAVLVVDDEPAVGAVLGRVLRDYDVTVVTSAKQALALIAAGRRFDVMLSDLMMPEMTGIELYDELARNYPTLAERTVFISGTIADASGFLERVSNERLDKPFDAATVRAAVQRVIK